METITYTPMFLVSYGSVTWPHLDERPTRKCSLSVGSHILSKREKEIMVSPRYVTHTENQNSTTLTMVRVEHVKGTGWKVGRLGKSGLT